MLTIATHKTILYEICIRVILFGIYFICDLLPPFERIIQPEELWLYKYPQTDSYIPMTYLWIIVIAIPCSFILVNYSNNHNTIELSEAFWCFSFIVVLNGALTNVIKLLVGRPRPDFIQRCFPDGKYEPDIPCTGNVSVFQNGRKSFPSGHSSVAFACFGFLSLYLAAKLRLFTPSGKSSSVKIVCVLLPLIVAAAVAISRTCDYHHHWEDVMAGSLLGIGVCYFCYFQYYPPLSSDDCGTPWRILQEANTDQNSRVKEI